MMALPQTCRPRGFTLIELMTVVAVLAVVAALAAPSFRTFIDNQRLRNASFDLVSDLLLARSEALKRARTVVITPIASDGEGWSQGWRVEVGAAGGELINERDDLPSSLRFAAMNSGNGALGSIAFGADGRVTIAGTPIRINVDFATPSPAHVKPSCVRLDATGRPRADKGACA